VLILPRYFEWLQIPLYTAFVPRKPSGTSEGIAAYLSEGKTLLKIQGWIRQGYGILDFNALLALFTNPSAYRIS
jgi:hypothetical protein